MEKILISSCLLGENTKYNGKNNYNPLVEKLKKKYCLISFCPEFSGGLNIPRNPSEIMGNKVISITKEDVTKQYQKGAKDALQKCISEGIHIAVLKEKSPSCGKYKVYDGTFTGTLIDASGITTSLLIKNGIEVFNENEIEALLK